MSSSPTPPTGPLSISESDGEFLTEHGYLLLRGLLHGPERDRVLSAVEDIETQAGDRTDDILDKSEAVRVLLGNPFVLRSAEAWVGNDFIPTRVVLASRRRGRESESVAWERDCEAEFSGESRDLSVDFFLDDADNEDACPRILPKSHLWPEGPVETARTSGSAEGAYPIPVRTGDALFRDGLLLYEGSSGGATSPLRVLTFQFRSALAEYKLGPRIHAYIPLMQRVLVECLSLRSQADWIEDSEPFAYRPPGRFALDGKRGVRVSTFRYPEEDYLR